ncbi:DUF3087 family protein [Motilimonas eburnea]|uniref:DUF3087 family protein n=1 Tax=Motilimonas eburnea TaxID=1737488 RepID=UPI001E4AB519|nr:DUF3087 family protein [Motilimonas eburnea]MCE2570612.1 DUF3087 domain-containing protein [Motilimonas eburnea]
MMLREINKQQYRQRLNRVIVAAIALLTVVALSISTTLIHFFGDEAGSNFVLNLAGVVLGGGLVLQLLRYYRAHPYMREVMYVWDLKHELNLINRKIRNIEQAAQQGDETAMQVLHFSYQGSRQLWQLDDNTITLDELRPLMDRLENQAATQGLHLDVNAYSRTLLDQF